MQYMGGKRSYSCSAREPLNLFQKKEWGKSRSGPDLIHDRLPGVLQLRRQGGVSQIHEVKRFRHLRPCRTLRKGVEVQRRETHVVRVGAHEVDAVLRFPGLFIASQRGREGEREGGRW